MNKISTLFRITYLTLLVVVQIAFWGCGHECTEPCPDPCSEPCPEPCLPSVPTEIGLTNIDTLNTNPKQIQYTFGWAEVAEAESYNFSLEIDGQIEHSETTENNEVKRILNLGENEVKFKVQSVCEDGTVSETIEEAFSTKFTIAAVEVVYRKQNPPLDVTQICNNSNCDFVKFGSNSTGTFCESDITYFPHYYFAIEDFCDCAEKLCESSSFVDCLKTKTKELYGADRDSCP